MRRGALSRVAAPDVTRHSLRTRSRHAGTPGRTVAPGAAARPVVVVTTPPTRQGARSSRRRRRTSLRTYPRPRPRQGHTDGDRAMTMLIDIPTQRTATDLSQDTHGDPPKLSH